MALALPKEMRSFAILGDEEAADKTEENTDAAEENADSDEAADADAAEDEAE